MAAMRNCSTLLFASPRVEFLDGRNETRKDASMSRINLESEKANGLADISLMMGHPFRSRIRNLSTLDSLPSFLIDHWMFQLTVRPNLVNSGMS